MTDGANRTTDTVIAALLGTLRACYPQRIPDNEWLVTVRRYKQEIDRFSSAAIKIACSDAWKRYPQWFPTLGQLVELCEAAQKTTDSICQTPRDRRLEDHPWDNNAAGRLREILENLNTQKAMP
jgi:hypothetical protein